MSATKEEAVHIEEKHPYNMGAPEASERGDETLLLSPAAEKRLVRKIDLQ